MKIQTSITQQKCIESLKGDALMPARLIQAEKIELVNKGRSVIMLCLGDKILREVVRDKTTTSI